MFPALSDNVKQWSAKNQHAKAMRFLTKISEAHELWNNELWKKNGGKGNWAKQLAAATFLKRAFIERHADAIRSGLKRFEPYCLRHTALTRLAEAGCDTFTLAKIAGHSSISITQRYVHPQADAIERAFGKLREFPKLAS